jgi:hypothetical protein
MPKRQRLLKLSILLLAPIAVIAARGTYAGTFWFYTSGEKYLASASSPSGQFRLVLAEERDGRCGDAGVTENGIFLKLERRAWLLKTGEFTPFCVVKDAADGLTVRWSGANELSISCPRCAGTIYEFYGGNWGQATFRLIQPTSKG